MNIYLHIGTQKTGTTTIQKMLTKNHDMLKNNSILYPKSLEQNTSQWSIAFLGYNDVKDDYFCIKNNIYNNDSLEQKQKQILTNLEDEINKNTCENIIISSEHIHSRLNKEELIKLKNNLKSINFKKSEIENDILQKIELNKGGGNKDKNYSLH